MYISFVHHDELQDNAICQNRCLSLNQFHNFIDGLVSVMQAYQVILKPNMELLQPIINQMCGEIDGLQAGDLNAGECL